ncbi:MAG: hypothetical protein BWY63_03075 [Chloroflexi bacterium ADurb.Bin360]|nr:MAG: hypothetical protein BWY63_03075 [Chloroflexi bacterium ADurb.Bin360]
MVEHLPGEAQFLPPGEIIHEPGRQAFPAVIREDDLEGHPRIGALEPETEAIVGAPVLEGDCVLAYSYAPTRGDVVHQHHSVTGYPQRSKRIGERHALVEHCPTPPIAIREPPVHVLRLEIGKDWERGRLRLVLGLGG